MSAHQCSHCGATHEEISRGAYARCRPDCPDVEEAPAVRDLKAPDFNTAILLAIAALFVLGVLLEPYLR